MKTEHVWFEVSVGGGSNSFATLEEARTHLADMKTGFKTKHAKGTPQEMTDENRNYWRRVSSKAEISKVVQTSEKVI